MMNVLPEDRQVLRELAQRVHEIGLRPEMAERRELWYAHNALRPKRPMVLASPEGAWADQRIMAQKLGKNHIFSRKPMPTLICAMFDEALIRQDLKETLRIAGQLPLEIIMKDTHTVQNQPQRVTRWVQLAYEEIGVASGRRR